MSIQLQSVLHGLDIYGGGLGVPFGGVGVGVELCVWGVLVLGVSVVLLL